MLKLNLQQLMFNKGIERHTAYLMKHGIAHHTASRLVNGLIDKIHTKHLEKLCLALHCTIDDLFKWVPEDDIAVSEDHPLQKLRAVELNLSEELKKLSPEQMRSIKEFITELRQS